ncbi:MAG TPA: glycosyltransferase family A protein [Herpetosiphonaceae bacterium]|nr:glycosyltransferase family A protein [Herpetosiphonaceae bacterium]
MENQPLVSVIVIFLNAEQFLEEAVLSVLAQSYHAWELLLVDDGSTDGSTAMALRRAREYPARIRYLEHANHDNRGMSAARNLGVRYARGELITFLDADDVWLPTTLQDQVAILQAQPAAAMVYGPIERWYSWSGKPEDNGRDRVEDPRVQLDALIQPPDLLIRFLRRDAAVPSGMLVRRAAIDRFGAFEEAFRGTHEDQVFCAKICLRAPVYVASACWYRYRQHEAQSRVAARRTGEYDYGRLPFLRWLASYLTEQGYQGTELWSVLQQELWWSRHPRMHRLRSSTRRTYRRFKRRLLQVLPWSKKHVGAA